jgi:hypothetical protein
MKWYLDNVGGRWRGEWLCDGKMWDPGVYLCGSGTILQSATQLNCTDPDVCGCLVLPMWGCPAGFFNNLASWSYKGKATFNNHPNAKAWTFHPPAGVSIAAVAYSSDTAFWD